MTPGTSVSGAPLGIFARTFSGGSPDQVLQQARDAGFDMVQYNMSCSGLRSLPADVGDVQVEALRSAIQETGVRIAALSATYNMIHPDPAARQAGHQALTVLARVAHRVGIPMLTLCSGSRDPENQWRGHADNRSAAAWRDLLESMTRALDVADRFDLTLAVEPEASNVVHSADVARRLLDEIGSQRLGVVIDAANLIEPAIGGTVRMRHDVVTHAVDTLADRIVLVHAKDRTADGAAAAPGHGIIDFDAYFRALCEAGVFAPVITHGLEATEAVATAAFLRGRLASGSA